MNQTGFWLHNFLSVVVTVSFFFNQQFLLDTTGSKTGNQTFGDRVPIQEVNDLGHINLCQYSSSQTFSEDRKNSWPMPHIIDNNHIDSMLDFT